MHIARIRKHDKKSSVKSLPLNRFQRLDRSQIKDPKLLLSMVEMDFYFQEKKTIYA